MPKMIEDVMLLTGSTVKDKNDITTEGSTLPPLAQARGLVRPNRTSMKFLNRTKDFSDIDESGDFTDEQNVKDAIKLANRMYELDGVVSNTIDVFVDFAISDFRFLGVKDERLLEVLEHFKLYVNRNVPMEQRGLKKFAETVTNQFYTTGNVFVEPKWSRDLVTHKNGRQKEYNLPTSIFFYDPQSITIDNMSGNLPIWVRIKPELYNAILKVRNGARLKDIPENLRNLVASYPKTVIDSAKDGGLLGARIPLVDIASLQRKKAPYNAWGTPYITRAFASLAVKHKLRNLDMDTIEGLINSITIFRVGTKDHVAKGPRINQFKSLMTDSPASRYLVWAHDIDAITVSPDNKISEMVQRYEQINAEILEDLGMPKAFTVGTVGGGAGSDPWIQILQLMERLTRHRRALSNIIEDWALKIAEENGFKAGKDYYNIRLQWKRNNLMSPEEIRQFVITFYDRGLISKETAVWMNDGDFETEINSRVKEAKGGEDDSIDSIMGLPNLPHGIDTKLQKNKETSEDNARPTKDKQKSKPKKEKTTLNDSE